ncbi:riboflavin synthase [Legionella sp. CNM-4043-24]|uniref:riboflavin synthase n=1 Tax=Legionella sp. CNM-4043-24 TaxID=3421646 RepID=UPI00403AE227
MFTGLIEQQSTVTAVIHSEKACRLVIQSLNEPDYQDGESIAVNGVCLTLLPGHEQGLAFDVSPETLRLTNLGQLCVGEPVNIERAMSAQGRFGGHYVSGHVDTTARLKSKTVVGDFVEIVVGDFAMPAAAYLLPKGSICLNGVSLTINAVQNGDIQLMLVPHTLIKTSFGHMMPGQCLNVEFDYLTRIVAHQLALAGQLKSEV